MAYNDGIMTVRQRFAAVCSSACICPAKQVQSTNSPNKKKTVKSEAKRS